MSTRNSSWEKTESADLISLFVTSPMLLSPEEQMTGIRQQCGNFTISTTTIPGLTMPLETTSPVLFLPDFSNLTEICLLVSVGPATAVPVNRVVNAGIYRVRKEEHLPGTLFDVGPHSPRFTPYLPFVAKPGSAPAPQRVAIHLDLDEYQ